MSSCDSADLRIALTALRSYCAGHGLGASCIILCGYPKSGNTLARFVYHNLIRVRNGGAGETLTYTQLNAACPNGGFPTGLAAAGFLPPVGIDHRGFPLMLHGHQPWSPAWREIGKTLFVHRDPLDALIGGWYATVDFPAQPADREPIDAFVLRNLPRWIEMQVTSAGRADAVLRYETVMRDAMVAFAEAFAILGIPHSASELAQAVAMSRFDRIRAMEDRHGQRHGHRADPEHRRTAGLPPWRDDPAVRFTRSGASGQWRRELLPDTIARARAMLDSYGLARLLTGPEGTDGRDNKRE
jgi:hypothetical protein